MQLAFSNSCCKDFVVTSDMIDRFNVNMYETADRDANTDLGLVDVLPSGL